MGLLRSLIKAIRRAQPLAGANVRVTPTPNGTIIEAVAVGGSTAPHTCKPQVAWAYLTERVSSSSYKASMMNPGADGYFATDEPVVVQDTDGGIDLTGRTYLASRVEYSNTLRWAIFPGVAPSSFLVTGSDAGIGGTWFEQSIATGWETTLSTEDWRGRHIEIYMRIRAPGDDPAELVTPVDIDLASSLSSDETIASEGVYSLVVTTAGHLKLTGSAVSLLPVRVWVRASAQMFMAPCSCPCTSWPGTSGIGWPCSDLTETILITAGLVMEFDIYASSDCSGTPTSHVKYRLLSDTVLTATAISCYWGNNTVSIEVTINGGTPETQTDSVFARLLTDECIWVIGIKGNMGLAKASGLTPFGNYVPRGCVDTGGDSRSYSDGSATIEEDT